MICYCVCREAITVRTAINDVLDRVLVGRVTVSSASVSVLLDCLVRPVDWRAPLVSGVQTALSHAAVINKAPPAATLGSRSHSYLYIRLLS